MELRIACLEQLPAGFENMRAAAVAEGFAFLDRLAGQRGAAWDARATLLGAFAGEELIAIGAQTADEYDPNPEHRRLRHFYVSAAWRRQGVGRMLANALTECAFELAPRLHLRATRHRAAAFWDAMGFRRVDHPSRTHEKVRP